MEKIHLLSFGCSNNFHEGEVMAGLLEAAGYEITKDPYGADIIILNLCTVKGDHQALSTLKETTKQYTAKIIAAGCILESTKATLRSENPSLSLLNTHNIHKIVEVVEAVIEGDVIDALEKNKTTKINLPKVRLNPIINIVPVGNGCTSVCTYCSVKLIKGNIQSYSIQEIVDEVKRSVAEGAKEIYLTGQDTGAYGLDWKADQKNKRIELPELIDALIRIEGDFMIRVGMTSPNHVYRHLDRLIAVYQHPKIYKFLHIPIQSGSNKVLKDMKRPYTVEQYKECITKFKKVYPEITIATDIIVGFPGETEAEFQETIKILEETKPNVVNRSRFAARPGTKAAGMKQVPTNTIKERSKVLMDVAERISREQNAVWKGWVGKALVDEYGKSNTMVARNYAYKPILLKGRYSLGEEVEVTIKETATYDLRAFVEAKSEEQDNEQPQLLQIRV
ncbi:tRNA (N(6)-L-threonylcarbamoyladenosine(37)-C(2))-methylthiotransferase [Candidatus Woesearchaeota archaeon]|nr:tRNA (N(6)-L-threonylcarbamoyladenosine(37)-C(2))-methylthiotransferase [Candidatus Woesearchaeota archaeon]